MKKKKEVNLEVKIVTSDYENGFDIEICEPETGDFVTRGFMYSPDEHPEFDEEVGNELYSWISTLMESEDEEDESD